MSGLAGDRSTLRETRRPIETAHHLPGHIYHAPEVLALEKKRLFMRDWLCVARVEELPAPGDYMALRVVGEPVLLVRGEDGALNAFSNICAHRGVEVASGSGSCKEFSCPYHGWTYRLDGSLIGAPYMRESRDFDAATCRLPGLRIETWQGWAFINFNDDTLPLAHHVAEFDRELGHLRQADCRLANKTVVTLDCNWKLVAENLVDIYHVHVLHANSFGKGRRPVDYLRDRPNLIGFYHAPPMAPGGQSPFGNMPWLADQPVDAACMGHLDPNLQLFGRSDAVHAIAIWPLTPSRSEIVFYDLLPACHFDLPDFRDRARQYKDYWSVVLEEDRSMIESLQNVMASERFRPGPMSSLEHGVHRLINSYLDRVFGPQEQAR